MCESPLRMNKFCSLNTRQKTECPGMAPALWVKSQEQGSPQDSALQPGRGSKGQGLSDSEELSFWVPQASEGQRARHQPRASDFPRPALEAFGLQTRLQGFGTNSPPGPACPPPKPQPPPDPRSSSPAAPPSHWALRRPRSECQAPGGGRCWRRPPPQRRPAC